MKFDELIAELDVQPATLADAPINAQFVSLKELLLRLQVRPAKHLTLTQAAHILLSLGFRMVGAPAWRCNGARGIVAADSFQTCCAADRLEYCYHQNHFESDGMGVSTDYDLFGFDRQEFTEFLQSKVGEPLDLFSPMPALQDATPSPAPVGAVGDNDWIVVAQNRAHKYIKSQKLKDLYPNQLDIADEIAREFRNAGRVGTNGKPLSGATIKRHALKGISSAIGKQRSMTIGRGK